MNFNMDPNTADRFDREVLWFRDAVDCFLSFRGDDEGDLGAIQDGAEDILYDINLKNRVENLVIRTLYLLDIHHYQYNSNREMS